MVYIESVIGHPKARTMHKAKAGKGWEIERLLERNAQSL